MTSSDDLKKSAESIRLIQSLSSSLITSAKDFGVSLRSLNEAGLSEFVKFDDHPADAKELGRNALNLAIATERHDWEGCWRPILTGIIIFMRDEGWDMPKSNQLEALSILMKQAPDLDTLHKWFDGAFPS